MIASRSHGDKTEVQKLLNTMPNAKLKIAGSSLKFCLIAEGKADIYPVRSYEEWTQGQETPFFVPQEVVCGHPMVRRSFTGRNTF